MVFIEELRIRITKKIWIQIRSNQTLALFFIEGEVLQILNKLWIWIGCETSQTLVVVFIGRITDRAKIMNPDHAKFMEPER